jgi:uncharacterized protein (DUF1015 family)
VARFEPFPGIRFDHDLVNLAAVTAPPYDVLSADDIAELRADRPHNVTWIDCPDKTDAGYADAGRLMREWIEEGYLTIDEPAFYAYRMGFKDDAGRAHQTSGILGALELMKPGDGDVLPHERTTPKDVSDRLNLLRSTHANLSPVWGLSMAKGLGAFAEMPGQPINRWTSDDGVHHRLYRIDEPAVVAAISAAVASAPVVIADGHHRYHTCLEYRNEWRAAHGDAAGGHDLTLCFMVELSPEQLFVQAIHRLLRAVPDGFETKLAEFFDLFDAGVVDASMLAKMDDAGALCLVRPDGTGTLLRPKARAFDSVDDLDSARLAHTLASIAPDTEVVYQHGVDKVLGRLGVGGGASHRGDADAAVLLRPVPVPTIEAFANERKLMPPKSTFFAPKPRTGVILRQL